VPQPSNLVNFTDTGTATNPRAATPIAAGTLFPPYWDVYGNTWPTLPNPMPLLPSGAIVAAGGGIPVGSNFTFLNPAYDQGLRGVAYPPGFLFSDGTPIPAGVVFAPDAPVPPTPVTPMYVAGTTFAPIRGNFTAPPFNTAAAAGVAGFTPAPGAAFLDGTPIPAGVILPPDCGVVQPWLPAPHQATPLYLPGTQFIPVSATPLPTPGIRTAVTGGSAYFNAGTNFVAVGTPFPAIPTTLPAGVPLPAAQLPTLNFQWMTPVAFVFCEYGHALAGFSSIQNHTFIPPPPGSPAGTGPTIRDLGPAETRTALPGTPGGTLTDVFGTADNTQIAGQLVAQGRVVMLSGDTGVSAYNHLHTHVLLDSSANFRPREPYPTQTAAGPPPVFQGPFGMIYSAPFVYADATHGIQHGFREAPQSDGVPRAMTWYESRNTRTGP
jgi:hypothetical protein